MALRRWLQFVDTLSVIGAKTAFDARAHWARRLVWILLLLAGTSGTFWLVSDRIRYYAAHHNAINMNIVTHHHLPFPTTVICPIRAVGKDWLEGKGLLDRYNAFITSAYAHHYDPSLPDMGPIYGPDDAIEFVQNASASLLPRDWRCAFKSGPCPADMFTPMGGEVGFCTMINGDPRYKYNISSAGINHGIKFNLEIRKSDILYADTQFKAVGFSLAIHDGEIHFNLHSKSVILPAGEEVWISFEKRVISLLNTEASPCQADVVDSQAYDKDRCLYTCLLKRMYAACRCIMPNGLMYEMEMWCNTTYEMNCNVVLQEKFVHNLTEQASCGCLEPCTRSRYEMVMSHSAISEHVLSRRNDTDYSEVRMYYSSLDVQHVQQREAYGFWSMMSDIGGALGLYMGSALFTLIEILDLILSAACDTTRCNPHSSTTSVVRTY